MPIVWERVLTDFRLEPLKLIPAFMQKNKGPRRDKLLKNKKSALPRILTELWYPKKDPGKNENLGSILYLWREDT